MTDERPMPIRDDNYERLKRYARGAHLIFENAEALYNEAQTLGQAGAFARAAVLHQISCEECSKIDTLGAVATSLLMGDEVDEARIAKSFRDHKAKNYANAYSADVTEEERAARCRGDWEGSAKAFKAFQKQFHVHVNALKNAGLYVDFEDGEFTAPCNAVSEAMAVAMMHLNADFLSRSDGFVRLLHKMETEPTLYAELVKQFRDRAESLRAAGEPDFDQIMSALMKQMRESYAAVADRAKPV